MNLYIRIVNKLINRFGYGIINNKRGIIEKIDFGKDILVAEVGTYTGFFAEQMLLNLYIKKLYCIDPYEYEKYDDSSCNEMKRAKKIANRRLNHWKSVKRIFKPSMESLEEVPNELDLIYIDGNHLYKYVKEDIENWYKKLKVGGILSGHDINTYYNKGVVKAVLEFCNEKNLELNIYKEDWWVVKSSEKIRGVK